MKDMVMRIKNAITKSGIEVQLIAYHGLSDKDLSAIITPFTHERGMSWTNNERVTWITASLDFIPVGIVALMIMNKGSECRFKSDVVVSLARGAGIYQALCEYRLELARESNATVFTAYAGLMSIGQFKKDGFKEASKGLHGSTYMVYNLTNSD